MRALLVIVLVAACGGGNTTASDCTEGETRPCYHGPAGTENVGACTPGVETCSGGLWPSVCVGDVTPFVEKCNGVDDDCNGDTDDAEDSGADCTIGGCAGVRGCAGDGEVRCIALPENECGLCGGPPVSGLGGTCNNDVCTGTLVCDTDKMSATCNAPQLNECEVCGGPAVADLGMVCTASAGCAGTRVCNATGTNSVCDCSANICNDGGTIRSVVSPLMGDLVITEVMPSPAQVGDAAGEWFEVRVLKDIDLNNLVLDRAGDTANGNAINSFDCIRVTAGTNLVFAKNNDPAMNGGIAANLIYGSFSFSLITGTPATPGDVRILAGTTVIDAITWTTSTNGKALQLDPDFIDAIANDNASNFCDATATYGLGDFGTPGVANTQCPVQVPAGQCDDGGNLRAIVPPPANALVISELMPNPRTEPSQEWFEITNAGGTPFDLNGLGLDRAGDTRAPDVIVSSACKSLVAGAYAVFARSSDPATNAGLGTVDATFGLSLVNGGGDIRVVDPATCAMTTPFACTGIYDSVAYTTAAGWPSTATADGVSAQLRPNMLTNTANDAFASFCAATMDYGTANPSNKGTPRAQNVCP